MKLHFFGAKRLSQVYFEIKYSLEKQVAYREYFTRKISCITFLGIPVKVISSIYVPSHTDDLGFEN
jgi:hypothetical protein